MNKIAGLPVIESYRRYEPKTIHIEEIYYAEGCLNTNYLREIPLPKTAQKWIISVFREDGVAVFVESLVSKQDALVKARKEGLIPSENKIETVTVTETESAQL